MPISLVDRNFDGCGKSVARLDEDASQTIQIL